MDAAVAAALVLAVTHPQAGNLGGGGFAVVRLGSTLTTLDFREVAPAAATRDMYLDSDGSPREGASTIGPLAAGVPGSPTGLFTLHEELGALPWREVVQPAVDIATQGFRLSRRLHRSLASSRERLARFPETAEAWLPGGDLPEIGDRLRFPELAASLAAYRDHGPEALTRGAVARRVVNVSARHGGILTLADLAAYEPVWRAPVRFGAFGWQFASMGLPTSGGIILGQVFGMLEHRAVGELESSGAERLHLVAEAWRQAFVDRVFLGDPASSLVESNDLLDPERIERLAGLLSSGRARSSRAIAPDEVALPREGSETTHLSVVDPAGGAVALTTTLNSGFGSKLWVPGFGFLNNEMDDFTTAPGQANVYGLIQGEANTVAPGRRMLSSMTPTVAWKGDEILVFGGQGGSLIPTATSWMALGVLVDGLPLQEAVDRPRIHHQWLPDRLSFEERALSPETRAELERRGHALAELEWTAKVCAVRRTGDGLFEAAGDPRGPDVGGVVDPQP